MSSTTNEAEGIVYLPSQEDVAAFLAAEEAERDRLWAEAQGRARDARARENARRSAASHRLNRQRGVQPVSVLNEWCGLCRSWQPRPHAHPVDG